MQTRIERDYFLLGFNLQRELNKVRGIKAAKMTWEEFSELPEFKATMHARRFNEEDMSLFKRGFLEAQKPTTP